MTRIKSVLFVICIVMVFTAQTKRPDEKGQPHAPAAKRSVPDGRRPAPVAHNNQARPQVQAHRAAPQQVVRQSPPRVEAHIAQPAARQERGGPRVYAVVPSAPSQNNRLFNRQHHNHWHPLYNYYNNQYQFYPYVNVTSPVELSADYVTVLFNGQTYYYDQGTFYVQDPQGFLAVPPPIGIIVSAIPQNAHQIDVDGQIYYRKKGVFYIQVAGGYQVVGPVASSSDGS